MWAQSHSAVFSCHLGPFSNSLLSLFLLWKDALKNFFHPAVCISYFFLFVFHPACVNKTNTMKLFQNETLHWRSTVLYTRLHEWCPACPHCAAGLQVRFCVGTICSCVSQKGSKGILQCDKSCWTTWACGESVCSGLWWTTLQSQMMHCNELLMRLCRWDCEHMELKLHLQGKEFKAHFGWIYWMLSFFCWVCCSYGELHPLDGGGPFPVSADRTPPPRRTLNLKEPTSKRGSEQLWSHASAVPDDAICCPWACQSYSVWKREKKITRQNMDNNLKALLKFQSIMSEKHMCPVSRNQDPQGGQTHVSIGNYCITFLW